jgi:hypothetical protein
LAILREYPTDGSCGYWLPREGTWEGTTQDIVYQGRTLCTGDPQKRSYCCGLTFEVFMKACERAGLRTIGTLTPDDAHELRLRFFGDSKRNADRRRLVQEALVTMGLGVAVDPADARAGDFVQFWRHSGSGHQAIFINWVFEKDKVVGLTYWSSQSSTRGIGYRTEWIGEKDGIKRDEIYLARARP